MLASLFQTTKTIIGTVVSLLLVAVVINSGCTSRYRMDFFMTSGEQSKKVKIERTEYVLGATIGDPFAEEKLKLGEDNCIILSVGTRGERLEVTLSNLLGYDEYFRCLVYLQIPPEPVTETIELADHSFAHVLGQYDIPQEQKIFLPESGFLAVDSISGKHLFATLNGRYQNQENASVGFEGRFKVKIAY